MSERAYYKRQFLNTENHEGVAIVEAKVSQATVNKDGYVNFDAELTLGDCSRQITLDFAVYGGLDDTLAKDIENMRVKLRRLRQVVAAFDREVSAQLDSIESQVGA